MEDHISYIQFLKPISCFFLTIFIVMPQAKSKTIVLNIIAPVMIFGLLGGLSAGIFDGCGREPNVTLEFWNVFDDSDVFDGLIRKFNEEHRTIKIVYRKKSYLDYESGLVDALAAGRGPDIFSVQNTWLPKHIDKISPMPSDIMNGKQFREAFVDVAAQDFILSQKSESGSVVGESIYALPLYVDTLALFWNKDIFNENDIAIPPKNWHEFKDAAQKLTKRDEANNILRSGAAFGTARNVNRAGDILMMLMMQTGAKMADRSRWQATFDESVQSQGQSFDVGQRALEFYTSFANPNKDVYAWNNKMDYSIDAFAQGKTAMMINYSYHIETIKAKDPHLRFALAPVPQPKDAKTEINYANYWGLTVSVASSPDEIKYAWIFLDWLTQQPQAKEYLEKTKKPSARRDLIEAQKNDLELGVFARQALSAVSWLEVDNLATDEIFNNMIDAVNRGLAAPEQALKKAASDVQVLMDKRGR